MGLNGPGSTSSGTRWLIPLLYALLVVAAVALILLLVAELIPESNESMRHLFVFDLAWPVFLVGSAAVLVAGVGALIAGRGRGSSRLWRFATLALAYSVVALVVLFIAGGFEL